MEDNNEFGEFSSVGEEWDQQNHLAPSFTPDWLAYTDNEEWASGVIPNNEQPWNASFPELPKELASLLSDEMITGLSGADASATSVINLPTNGSGLEVDEFGDFESSLNNPEVVMTTNEPSTTGINIPLSSESSNIESSVVTNKSESWATPGFGVGIESTVDEDDEFGDFKGPSIPKQPDMVQASKIVVDELEDEAEDEFGGFVSTTAEVKEKAPVEDDFGSFEAAEFVSASSFPPSQPTLPAPSTQGAMPSNFGATPTNTSPPPSFSTIAESCFQCKEQVSDPQSSVDHQSLNNLAEKSSLWSSLQSGMKTTSPLYAWNKSHLEDQYFCALKVDPMLVYTILSFAEEMGMAPLAPQDQLLADEGFQWPDSPTQESRPREVAATLLDLTLSSPVSTTPSKALSRHESFTLDADLLGLDFTLTDDLQPTTTVEEETPIAMVTEASNSKTADAIADILGLSTNPYLTNKEENNQPVSDAENTLLNETGAVTTTTTELPSVMDTLTSQPMDTLTSQPLDSLVVSKDELQSIMPSQETLDALKVSPSILQSLAVESDSKAVAEIDQPVMNLSSTAQNLLSSLPTLPEVNQPLALSNAAQHLLDSLPDVTFILSNTHSKHIHKYNYSS